MHPKDISLLPYTYLLPDERIALFPLPERDDAKLLIYKNGTLQEDRYKNIAQFLPAKSLLLFNDTRVIQARVLFQKTSGGSIEIFCLEPFETVKEYNTVMGKKERSQWKCLIGGASKWKEGVLIKQLNIQATPVELQARLVQKLPDAFVVELSWQPGEFTFAEIIDQAGDTPLPPYIKRKPAETDKERYQTIYAKHDGSVAAPTAGLHFTPGIFSALKQKGISSGYITLHVGAGTFKPVKSPTLNGHRMHAEWIEVAASTIYQLLENISNGIIPVGTTSLRTLESIYWMGVKSILYPESKLEDLTIYQWDVYEEDLAGSAIPVKEAFIALLSRMKKNDSQRIIVQTQILIAPGYKFKVARALITNFHQPQSTLLLLIAAAIGEDWKQAYNYALENDFRFLSYGDGSLLFLPAPADEFK
ncbi:MAG: S-adenosylmethionine:tRNA ribosyltransferase-isomerase [Ferruginibacter sp.]